MTAARRLAAILAADVVGYSRLMGEDEAGTALGVREHREAARPIVAGLGGRIVKTTGDGLLLEFPSVVAAVECAIAIQKLMVERNAGTSEAKRIVYRIGVNLGDVLIEGDDILGDGVNIAARLEGICEPGGVLISGAAYDHVRGRIDADFVDLGDKDLKNIARPVRVYAVKTGSASAAPAPSAAEPNRQGPPRLSMVVLPFANIGGDPEQEHFVDGVTESLTTDLSRIRGSFVIARNTAFTYKGKPLDVKPIGRELNVRYVLEGSVQRGGDRMRVNVQLIDAETGNHLWAERFDKPLADLFDMQDEIVARLANALNAQLVAAEARARGTGAESQFDGPLFSGEGLAQQGYDPCHFRGSAPLFRSRARRRSQQCRRAQWIGGSGRDRWRKRLCRQSHGGLRGGRSEIVQSPIVGPRPSACAYVLGTCRNMDEARCAGHRRMRACVGAGSKSRQRPSLYRTWKDFCRSRRGNRGSHWRGPAAQSARYVGLCLGEPRGPSEAPPRKLRAGGRVVSAVDRGQPKLSAAAFCVGRRASRSLVDWTRRIPQSRPASRSTRPSRSPASAPLWTATSDDPTYLAQLEPILEGLRKAGVPEQ